MELVYLNNVKIIRDGDGEIIYVCESGGKLSRKYIRISELNSFDGNYLERLSKL